MMPIDDPSVEQILVHVARSYAPRLLPADWRKPGDLKKPLHVLARELAAYHVLVLLARRDNSPSQTHVPLVVQECHELYVRMYRLLVSVSFPSLVNVNSFFFHGRTTLMIVFEADARRVVEVLAGYVSPYVAERQGARSIAPMEVQGLIDRMLKKLDLPELTPEQHQHIRAEGTAIIKQMLKMPLQQMQLTIFDEPFFDEIAELPPPPPKPIKPPLTRLPGEFTKPFADGTLPILNGDDPEFIQHMWDEPAPAQPREDTPAQTEVEPRSPLTPNLNNPQSQPPSGDTGQLKTIREEWNWPTTPSGNTLPRPPLPPPRRRDDSER